MATPTYDFIDSTTLASSTSSVTFSSISQDYRDLIIFATVIPVTGAGFPNELQLEFNTDSGTNYSYVTMRGRSSTTQSLSNTSETSLNINAGLEPGEPALYTIQIMDYTATDKQKAILARSGHNHTTNSRQNTTAFAGRWASTSALSQIEFTLQYGISFDSGTTFALYGIAS